MNTMFYLLHKLSLSRLPYTLAMAVCLILACSPHKVAAQLPYYKWAGGFTPATGSSCTPRATTIDTAGNMYITGYFTGTVDFDPGAGTANVASSGSSDVFVCKLDATGAYVWAVKMGGASADQGYGIAVDGSGNVYTTGYFSSSTAYFDPASTSTHTLATTGGNDIFVSKLDAGGNYLWAVKMGGTGTEQGYGVAVDGSGNVYTTGYFNGSTVYFDPGSTSTHTLSSAGNDIFVSKLDATGAYVWAVKMGGTGGDQSYAIAVDNSGNVYTTGSFAGAGAYFDPNSTTSHTLDVTGSSDIFISKLDASGNYVWAGRLGGGSADAGFGIAVDGLGNIYTTGYFSGSGAYFDPNSTANTLSSTGSNDIFVSKLDASGNYVWAGRMGGAGSDQGYGIAVDGSGNVYTTGYFAGSSAYFDPASTSTHTLSSGGGNDVFISKLSATGGYGWAVNIGADTADQGYGIATDGLGNMYATGYFNGTVNFNPGSTSNLTSSNGSGGYALKWAECSSMNTAATAASATTSPMFMGGSNQPVSFRSNCDEIARLTPSGASPVSGSVTTQVFIDGSVQSVNGNSYVQRHYDILPAASPNTATATVALYFTQAEFDAYNTAVGAGALQLPTGPADAAGKANLRIAQYHGTPVGGSAPGNYPSTWGGTGPAHVAIDPADAGIVWNAGASRWEVNFDITGFSGFFAYASNSSVPLAVKLLSFKASLVSDNDVLLNWRVANGTDGSEYTIERSVDGSAFYAVSVVAATNAGEYTLHDYRPFGGRSYYRLRIVEKGGHSSYSNIETVFIQSKNYVQIVPAPAHEHITIATNATGLSATLIDMQGKVLHTLAVSDGMNVDISRLPAGVYLLKLNNGEAIKVVKE